jgi:hypothetical protein
MKRVTVLVSDDTHARLASIASETQATVGAVVAGMLAVALAAAEPVVAAPVNQFEAVDPSSEEDFTAEYARDARGRIVGEIIWRPARNAASLIGDVHGRSVYPESSLAGARVQHDMNKGRFTR